MCFPDESDDLLLRLKRENFCVILKAVSKVILSKDIKEKEGFYYECEIENFGFFGRP